MELNGFPNCEKAFGLREEFYSKILLLDRLQGSGLGSGKPTDELRDLKQLIDVGFSGKQRISGPHFRVEATDRPDVDLPDGQQQHGRSDHPFSGFARAHIEQLTRHTTNYFTWTYVRSMSWPMAQMAQNATIMTAFGHLIFSRLEQFGAS